MDKSIVAVEESHRRSDYLASSSKPLGSLVQINSIAIDISCAMDKEIELSAHDHFSIRGFVAGMRKKDWKVCSPFGSEGDGGGDLVDKLPPLSVPRSRWWQCSNCVPDIAAVEARSSSFENIDGEKDGFFTGSIQNIGDGHGLRDFGHWEDGDPSNKIINSNPRCTERHKAKATTSGSKEKTDVEDNNGGNRCACLTEANPFPIRDGRDQTADASDMVHVVDNPPFIVEEPENTSSGSDGAFSALPYKRKPKLRYLADIMEEEKNSTNEHPRTRSASSSGVQVTSTEIEVDLDPRIQFDVPADIAKDTRSPPKKRKFSIEEDRGPLETIYPIDMAKRFKSPIPYAEKTCRRVEIFDSEREGDVSGQPDLQLNAKTQQIKLRKNKALDINRKIRRNLQKCADAAGTGFGNTGHVPLTPGGEIQPYSRSFLSEQPTDRIYNLSKSKRPEVEAGHSPLMPPSKSVSVDCDIGGKVALDLSRNGYLSAERNFDNQESFVQHRGIPDLNESFTEKTSMMQGKQVPTFSETRSLTLQKTLDMSESCSKETAREGKRQFGISEPQAVPNVATNLEPRGASDDIPMEIVELLAKNQRDKELGKSAVYMNGRPANGMINFPFVSTSGTSVSGSKTGGGRGILSFPQVNSHSDMGNPDESQFRVFSSFTPSHQRKTQYSAPNSILSGPRTSEGADLLWPPRRKNVPFQLTITENQAIQPNGLGVHIKGKDKQVVRDASVVKRISSGPKSVRSLDAYSNDTIPAMQLLSLMDRGIVSTSSFKTAPTGFLDKPFPPCNHHTQLKENQNDPFHNSSFFSQSSHTKSNFPGLLNGVCFSGESFKKSYLQGQKSPEQGNSTFIHLDGPNNHSTRPSIRNLSLDICTLNRNPADFSIPDARNEFTITAKDLKPRKKKALKVRSRPTNMEAHKRSKARKLPQEKNAQENKRRLV